MKTFSKTITIKIPTIFRDIAAWVDYNFRKTKLLLFPFKCDCCGAKMYVRQPMYEHTINGKRLIVDNMGEIPICRSCLAFQLETGDWTPRFTSIYGLDSKYNYENWEKPVCDITGERVPSYKDVEITPHVNMLFSFNGVWNAGWVSKSAIIETVRNGSVTTSSFRLVEGKMLPVYRGVFITKDGKLA